MDLLSYQLLSLRGAQAPGTEGEPACPPLPRVPAADRSQARTATLARASTRNRVQKPVVWKSPMKSHQVTLGRSQTLQQLFSCFN